MDPNVQASYEQLLTLLVLFGRTAIQRQFVGFIIALVVAWLLSDGLWKLVGHRISAWGNVRLAENRQRYWQWGLLFVEFLAFPIIGLVIVDIMVGLFQLWGWLTAALEDLGGLFNFILPYRLLIVVLYILLGRKYMRVYHHRFLAPLFTLFVLHRIFSSLIDLEPLSQLTLLGFFDDPLTVGELLTAIIAVYFWIYLSRAVKDLLQQVIAPHTHADPNVIDAALTIGRYVVIVIGIVLVAAVLGVDPSTLAFISGGLSVGIGFGLQSIVSNFISGIVLLFEQSLRPGDVIEVNGILGTVARMGIRATTVRSFDNVELIVPNETLFSSTVTTYTQTSRITRIVMTIGVSYDSDPREVMEILLEAAQEHGQVREEPAPAVFFQDFGASSLDFHLAIWLDDPELRKRVPSDLRSMIWNKFEKRGIEIPFPQRDLHIRSGLPWDKLGIDGSETMEPIKS